MRARRKHSREFRVEAVKLVRERGVTVAQAACDLELSQPLACQVRRCREVPEGDRVRRAAGTSPVGRHRSP